MKTLFDYSKFSIALGIALGDTEAKGIEQNSVEPETTEAQTVDSETDDEIRSTPPLKEAVKEIVNVITYR
jgi:hypothetical protein